MKLKINGSKIFQIIDNKISTTTGDNFIVKEEDGYIVLSNVINSIEKDFINTNKEIHINYNDFYELTEKISEIIMNNSSTLKIFNSNCLTENINIILTNDSFLKLNIMLINTMLVSISGNAQIAINDSKSKHILANISDNSTLKFINSDIEQLIANSSGNSTIIKDKTTIHNFVKNLTDNSNIITV